MGSLQTVAGATERLIEILDTKAGIVAPARPVALPTPPLGTIAFEDVSFSYETRDNEQVLSNLSFAVRNGETVALVGASGAGKSTVFALAQRFYDVSSGRIMRSPFLAASVYQLEARATFSATPSPLA